MEPPYSVNDYAVAKMFLIKNIVINLVLWGSHMRAIKDLKAPFPDLKAVLLFIVYFSTYICFPIFLSY